MESHKPVDRADAVADEAGAWMVRWDRGLDPAEEIAFERWKALTPGHARAFEQARKAWERFDGLARRRGLGPVGLEPVLRPVRGQWSAWPWALGAAAVLAVVGWVGLGRVRPVVADPGPPPSGLAVLVASDRRFLADGSVVDLSPDAVVDVTFTPGERRIRLLRGAGHFQVMRDPHRPFVVTTATGVEVRALGTAFDVWMESDQVDVRVSSGRVQVKALGALTSGGVAGSEPVVGAGHRVVVPLVGAARPLLVAALPPVERVEVSLPLRYEFERTPLSRVVSELNRRGGLQLEVVDPELADLPIYASCRADNLESFVRLLEATGELASERTGTTLRLTRPR